MNAKVKNVWSCTECGNNQYKWLGQCPSCNQWNTFKQDTEEKHGFNLNISINAPVAITSVVDENAERMVTSMPDFDRIVGGGVVKGGFVLLGGDPGIGKSTLLLQISSQLAALGHSVLYVCGEESVAQTSMRARRLNIKSDNLLLLSETNFDCIQQHAHVIKPDVLVIDSIQIVYKPDILSSPGSIAQVRDIAAALMIYAKQSNTAVFIIGHVTKSGEIAGPRVLEHLVDTVLYFEGDRNLHYRMIRVIKNRFGPTNELAVFEMGEEGLKNVINPSAMFLRERGPALPGSVIIPTAEGSRTILIELQALVTDGVYSNSLRRTTGIDQNRLTLLLAVLEKRLGCKLYNKDVFVSIAGGIKIVEPATDLGSLIAVISSLQNILIPSEYVILGEVGLGGEIRNINRLEQRIKESVLMGFSSAIVPLKQISMLSTNIQNQIKLIGVNTVQDAFNIFFR